MAYNPLEELKKGNCFFLDDFMLWDKEETIKEIRQSNEKDEIIRGFLSIVIDKYPYFCFKIIYDNPLCGKETLYLLNKYIGPLYMNDTMFENFLNNSPIAEKYLLEHLEELIKENDIRLEAVFRFIFNDIEAHTQLMSLFRLHKNLHIRARFMIYIASHHPHLLNVIYDDFMKYLTSYTHQEFEQLTFLPELMNKKDISLLAVTLTQKKDTLPYYYKLKEYILKTYPENDIAYFLTLQEKDIFNEEDPFQEKRNEILLLEDIDRLFQTSNKKIYLFERFSQNLSGEIREKFARYLSCFNRSQCKDKDDDYYALFNIYNNELGKKLEELTEKYLSLSKNPTSEYLRDGSTASAFRIGDFVFKLSHRKWSYEDIICPDLYLFHQNLEEILIRDPESQRVIAGIEVQTYLKRNALEVPHYIFALWNEALHNLGWDISDTLMGGRRGNNARLLDSYKDACTSNLKALPDWFLEYPLVNVDRDRVYRLSKFKDRKEIPEYIGD